MIVGQVTNCAYEFDHHWNAALKAGSRASISKRSSEFETSPHFTTRTAR